MNKRKLKYGMVGGGHGAFIGAVHRMAANLDGQLELVCGAFSSKPEKSKASGADLFLPEERCYGTFEEMMLSEAALPSDVRMDFVVIVTPNHLHFPAAKSAMENGFHVVSDKPATLTADEARTLRSLSKKTGLLYALTHNYTGYPMVRQARVMVRDGMLGKIRKVVVEYPQGWLSQDDGGVWRTDPAIAGAGGCLGDIGSHAENLAAYITGLDLDEIAADLTAFVEGRRLDDDVNVLLRYKGGAKGILQSSQIAVGEEMIFESLCMEKRGAWSGVSLNQTPFFSNLMEPRFSATAPALANCHPKRSQPPAFQLGTPRDILRPLPIFMSASLTTYVRSWIQTMSVMLCWTTQEWMKPLPVWPSSRRQWSPARRMQLGLK